ncbi:MAG: hypothetical protein NC541_15295 [bacterium]|nr:hypothetical protein [bacterium]
MKEGKLQEIAERLAESPEQPLFIPREDDAAEAYERLYPTHPALRLVTVHGISYLADSDAALRVLLELLDRELRQYRDAVKNRERQIAGIQKLLGTGRTSYCNPAYTLAPPVKGEAAGETEAAGSRA